MNQEFREGLAEILEVDASEITSETVLGEGNWDSLAVVSTIALIDEVYDETVGAEQLSDCKTVGDLESLVSSLTDRAA